MKFKFDFDLVDGKSGGTARSFEDSTPSAILVLSVPSKIISDQATPEEILLRDFLIKSCKAASKGKQGIILLPSETDESGKPLYSVTITPL